MFTWWKRWKLKGMLKQLKKYQQQRENGDKASQVMEIQMLNQIAAFFVKQRYNKYFPQARMQEFEYYRAAAGLNDAKAQYACALMCFDVAKFYQTWFESAYSREIHKRYMTEAYQQAYEFLNAAEANNYVEAKRYKGLAYIYGWGVEKDTTKGFNLILDSIQMENAWSQATKIIEKLHLNSPEFFKALTMYQSQAKD